ncbi:MAG: M15 family metallopeptidase [Patescibacteria group bacterium]
MKFVDLAKYKFVMEPRYYFYGWSKSKKITGQEKLAKALARARKFLPAGYNFKIWDCQRSRAVQLKMIENIRRRFCAAYPRKSKKEIEKLVFTFAAKPKLRVTRPDCHRHGGAIHLTIVDKHGQELYMGTDFDDLTARAALDYFEKKAVSVLDRACPPKPWRRREAQKNRRLLKKVLTQVGFENFAPEWWHWSIL